MNRLFVELKSTCDWRQRLGEPEKHWRRGASAMELAVQWMAAQKGSRGMPSAVSQILDTLPVCADAHVLLAVPELCTPVPGRGKPSQTDLWALLSAPAGLITLSVEAKATEDFGPRVGEWLAKSRESNANRRDRLQGLCQELGLDPDGVGELRYQLLHRTVACLLEATRWRASAAILLVQHFCAGDDADAKSWEDFVRFAARLRCRAERGAFSKAEVPGRVPLWIGWLDCDTASDRQIASVLA